MTEGYLFSFCADCKSVGKGRRNTLVTSEGDLMLTSPYLNVVYRPCDIACDPSSQRKATMQFALLADESRYD